MMKYYYTYITASINRVVYVGFTDDLVKRITQHKKETFESAFTKKYKVNRLVYWECHYTEQSALKRERELKAWRREKKIVLIEKENPRWKDLYNDVVELSKARSSGSRVI